MGKEELEEVMRVVNKVIDKKIHKLKIELSGEMEKHDKRIGKVEKNSQTIYQELNFYIDARKVDTFHENVYILWKNEHDIEWIDDMAHITQICISNKYGSRTRVFNLILSHVDLIYLNHEKLQVQLKRDLAIMLGFNVDDYKSYQAFKNAYYKAIDSIIK